MDWILVFLLLMSGWLIWAAWYLDSIPPEEMRAARDEFLKHHRFWWQ